VLFGGWQAACRLDCYKIHHQNNLQLLGNNRVPRNLSVGCDADGFQAGSWLGLPHGIIGQAVLWQCLGTIQGAMG
jgi:hypothetical protein